MKECFIDVETTGTDPKKNGIVQLAGIIRVDGKNVDEFNITMHPKGKEVEAKALEVIGKTMKDIEQYQSYKSGYRLFKQILHRHIDPYNSKDKLFFIAYNSPFDNAFVRQFFTDNNDKYFGSVFWVPDICVMRLLAFHLRKGRAEFKNYQLSTVAKYFEIDAEGAHDALKDVYMMVELYDMIIDNEGITEWRLL